MAEGYLEWAPIGELAAAVRTVWVQRTGAAAYVQRHLPTGGVELHCPVGGRPQVVGPLTGAKVEVIPPHTTLVGSPRELLGGSLDRCGCGHDHSASYQPFLAARAAYHRR